MQALAFQAYGEATRRTASGRALERAVFDQITRDLQIVHDNDGADPVQWADAIQRNMQLWTIIATDVLNPENGLPEETRAALFSLSEFVRRTSLQVFSRSASLEDVIAVNRAILAGLDGSIPTTEQEVF